MTNSASRIGTMDPMDLTQRIYVDQFLAEVEPDSPDVAFTFRRSEIEAFRKRRAELGFDNDEALRVQTVGRKAEIPRIEAQVARLEAELAILRESTADPAQKEEVKS